MTSCMSRLGETFTAYNCSKILDIDCHKKYHPTLAVYKNDVDLTGQALLRAQVPDLKDSCQMKESERIYLPVNANYTADNLLSHSNLCSDSDGEYYYRYINRNSQTVQKIDLPVLALSTGKLVGNTQEVQDQASKDDMKLSPLTFKSKDSKVKFQVAQDSWHLPVNDLKNLDLGWIYPVLEVLNQKLIITSPGVYYLKNNFECGMVLMLSQPVLWTEKVQNLDDVDFVEANFVTSEKSIITIQVLDSNFDSARGIEILPKLNCVVRQDLDGFSDALEYETLMLENTNSNSGMLDLELQPQVPIVVNTEIGCNLKVVNYNLQYKIYYNLEKLRNQGVQFFRLNLPDPLDLKLKLQPH